MQTCTLAVDIGASSGRHIAGTVQNGKITLQEVYRFENGVHRENGHLCWDIDTLAKEVVNGLKAAHDAGFAPATIGIDTWGVGTRLITSEDNPALGGVYKMAAEVVDGRMVPKIKLSDNPAKVTNPGYKKVFRLYDLKGMAIADLIALDEETIDTSKPLRIFDPEHPYKNMLLKRFNARELLVPVFLKGKRVYDSPSLPEIQAYCRQQVDTLWDEVKRFDNPHKYVVDLSRKLWDIQQELLRSSQR